MATLNWSAAYKEGDPFYRVVDMDTPTLVAKVGPLSGIEECRWCAQLMAFSPRLLDIVKQYVSLQSNGNWDDDELRAKAKLLLSKLERWQNKDLLDAFFEDE